MIPATREQGTFDRQENSDDNTWYPDPDEIPVVRKEFGPDCDINRILQRGGVPIFTRQPTYGEIDFEQDLHSAIMQVRQADTLFMQLPGDIRAQYRDRNRLIKALDNGQITDELDKWLKDKPEAATSEQGELLKWLKAQRTEPASSASPRTETQPTPDSARAEK